MPLNPNGLTHTEADVIEHINGLYGYALVLTRNHSEAEDLVQETYIRAIRAMKRLRTDSNVKGWMFTILRNIWRNHLRKRRTAPEMVSIDGDESNAVTVMETSKDPLASYISSIERDQVRKAIQQLPLDFREIILLREFEELSYLEIAKILDCQVGTVMSRLSRARSKLRMLLSSILHLPSERETEVIE
jgi:RNA polymerase sigma-70 factor (ECF subfamily)